MDMSLSKFQEMVKDRKPGVLQSMGLQRVGHNWMTEHTPRQLESPALQWKIQHVATKTQHSEINE